MILTFGGIKGGEGKSTLATNITILRAKSGKDVLLVDADEQASSSDFSIIRNEALESDGGAGYTAIKLHGASVRVEVQRLVEKYDDIIIDVGGRDTAGQRAALSITDIYAVPFLPASFDIWTLEKVAQLVEEAQAFNVKLKALCFLNKADPIGSDNAEAAEIAKEIPQLTYFDCPLVNRKAYRNAAAKGLGVTELKPPDNKACDEIRRLYRLLFDIKKKSKKHQSEV